MNTVCANENNLKKGEKILLSQQRIGWIGNTEPGLSQDDTERFVLHKNRKASCRLGNAIGSIQYLINLISSITFDGNVIHIQTYLETVVFEKIFLSADRTLILPYKLWGVEVSVFLNVKSITGSYLTESVGQL